MEAWLGDLMPLLWSYDPGVPKLPLITIRAFTKRQESGCQLS